MNAGVAALRLVLVTDGRGDADRVCGIVEAAVAGGVRCVQLREPGMTARELAALCRRTRPLLRGAGGLLLVSDRADVAAAGLADGVHLGHRALLPAQVRGFLPPGSLLGVSAHDSVEAEAAVAGGADYVSLSPVFPTRSKPGCQSLGPERTATIAAGLPVPAVWLGGITAERVRGCAACRPHGVAVMSAVAGAEDPRAAAAELDAALAEIGRARP